MFYDTVLRRTHFYFQIEIYKQLYVTRLLNEFSARLPRNRKQCKPPSEADKKLSKKHDIF